MTQYVYKHVFTPSEQNSPQHMVYAVADCPVKAAILAQAFAISGGLAWKRFKQTIDHAAGEILVHMTPCAWAAGVRAPNGVHRQTTYRAGEYIVEDGTARYEDKSMEAFPPKECWAPRVLSLAERDRVALAVWYSLTEQQRQHAKQVALTSSGIYDLDPRAAMSINPVSGCNGIAVISFSSSKYSRCMSMFITHAKAFNANIRRGETPGRLLANWSDLAASGVFGARYHSLYLAALTAQPA